MAGAAFDIEVPRFFTFIANSIAKHPKFWTQLGRLESGILAPDLMDYPVTAPIYVNGLARSGSTLLLEFLAAHPDTASHRYHDFPFILTPYWWKMVLKFSPFKDTELKERAHGDGMMINAASPEAMEEIVWMTFFTDCHNSACSNVLRSDVRHDAFQAFYLKHIQKLLLAGKASRYVSKGNYNITRMEYIQSFAADARFVIPVRHPHDHIASLMRQHARFCKAHDANTRVGQHMALAGHFEFGPMRRPIHCGDDQRIADIEHAWKHGEDVLGWALYWDMLHRFIYNQRAGNSALRDAGLLVRYEDVCRAPHEQLSAILDHCMLSRDGGLIADFSARIKAPDYYESPLSAEDKALIDRHTRETATLLGYTY